MIDYECPNCRSDEPVETNPTNYAALYYCSACNHPFDPREWPCPKCQKTTPVTRNPLDPHSYYCHECEMVFNRLDPAFEREIVSSPDEKPIDIGPHQLAFAAKIQPGSTTGTHKCGLTLRNVGSTTVRTHGPRHIALQYRVTDDEWWSIYGNPARFRSGQRTHLQPKQTLNWSLEIRPRSILGDTFEISRDAFPSGQYRVVYWGLPEADVLPAVKIPVEFDDTLHGW